MHYLGLGVSDDIDNTMTINMYYVSYCSNFVRSQVIFANTLFKAVCYRTDESQIITGGTDRKVYH